MTPASAPACSIARPTCPAAALPRTTTPGRVNIPASPAPVFLLKRGAGSCDVTFVMDGRVSIIPLSGDVTVRAAIAPKIPVTANRITSPPALDAFVFAPTADTKNIVITDLTPDTPATQAAVTAAPGPLPPRRHPGGGASLGDGVDDNNPAGSDLPQPDRGRAVQSAEGVAHFTLTTPSSDITSSTGHIPVLGTITFRLSPAPCLRCSLLPTIGAEDFAVGLRGSLPTGDDSFRAEPGSVPGPPVAAIADGLPPCTPAPACADRDRVRPFSPSSCSAPGKPIMGCLTLPAARRHLAQRRARWPPVSPRIGRTPRPTTSSPWPSPGYAVTVDPRTTAYSLAPAGSTSGTSTRRPSRRGTPMPAR